MATERGVVEDDERRMIQSVIDLADTHVREIMVPRPEMVWIEQDKNAAQAASLAIRSGHSRLPVIGENPDDIRGVVYLKDVTSRAIAGLAASVDVADVMRPAQFIPDSRPSTVCWPICSAPATTWRCSSTNTAVSPGW